MKLLLLSSSLVQASSVSLLKEIRKEGGDMNIGVRSDEF